MVKINKLRSGKHEKEMDEMRGKARGIGGVGNEKMEEER